MIADIDIVSQSSPPADASIEPRRMGRSPFLVLELQFLKTARPSDTRDSTDNRLLAVGFRKISVSFSNLQEKSIVFQLNEELPDSIRLIYGFGETEHWGVWSVGQRSCFLLEFTESCNDALISVDHMIFNDCGPEVPARAWINGIALPDLSFCGGNIDLCLPSTVFDRFKPDAQVGSSEPRLSVVIVNYQRWDLTAACVNAVLASKTGITFEIIVVDNGSDDASFSRLERAGLPIRLIRLDDRRSFGEANNIAVESARGSLILFLNNDAFVRPSCVDLLNTTLETDASIGAAGPIFYFPDGRVQEAGAFVAGTGMTFRRIQQHPMEIETLSAVHKVDYVSGACLMMKRELFLRLGGFDPVYEPAYNEDVDLCLRLQAAGLQVALVSDAECLHIGGATRESQSDGNIAQAPLLSSRIFASRWRSWLWTKANSDLPGLPKFSFDEWRKRAATVPMQGSCAIFIDEPLHSTGEGYSAIAAIAALSGLRPCVVASSTAYSGLRVMQMAERFSKTFGVVTTAGERDPRVLGAQLSVHISGILPPRMHKLPGTRRILYCPTPQRPQKLSVAGAREAVRSILDLDCIVTDSLFARDQIQKSLRAIRAPIPLIEVIYPPVISNDASPTANTAKKSIVVCMGDFSQGPSGGNHIAVLRAFRTFLTRASREHWRLVCIGDLKGGNDLSYVGDLENAGAALPLDIMLNPSRRQAFDLFTAAKVIVVAQGLGVTSEDDASMCTMSGAESGTAIGFGCVPIVFECGAAAEMCEAVGIGFRIASAADLAEALEDAAAFADRSGVGPAHRRRLVRFEMPSFGEAWRRVIFDDQTSDPTEADVDTPLPTHRHRPRRIEQVASALVVTGMHRSGTSAMARVLSLSGAALPKDVMPARPDNPAGFWEPLQVVEFNDRALQRVDLHWSDIFCYARQPALIDPYGESIVGARDVIRDQYRDRGAVVLKDPRISLLLHLWDGALIREHYDPFYILMVRDPFEVAESLFQRNGMPRSQAILLWANYMVAATRDSFGLNRIFVAYDDLVASPLKVLDRIEDVSQRPLPRRSTVADLEIERFIRRDHRHHVRPQNTELDGFPLVDRLYQALFAAACGHSLDPNILADVEAWLAGLQQVVGPTLAALKTAGGLVR